MALSCLALDRLGVDSVHVLRHSSLKAALGCVEPDRSPLVSQIGMYLCAPTVPFTHLDVSLNQCFCHS